MQLAWELPPGAADTAVSAAAIWIWGGGTERGAGARQKPAEAEGPESPGPNLLAAHEFEVQRFWQGTK